MVSGLVHQDLSVLLTRGPGEPASGPIELHYTRAAIDPEDVRLLEIGRFPGAFDAELASY